MPLTEEKYRQGMTVQQYIDQIKVNKEPFVNIYRQVELTAGTHDFLGRLKGTLRLAVFTADWCGDAMSTTPVLLRLAESSDRVEVMVFNRDEELELTNSFLSEDRAGTVPVIVAFDSSMSEIARFVETANELVPAIDAMDEEIARQIAEESEESPRAAVRSRRTAFRVAHAREWGSVILDAFVRTVDDGIALAPSKRPTVGGTRWPQP